MYKIIKKIVKLNQEIVILRKNIPSFKLYWNRGGGIAQLGERLVRNEKVRGSNPLVSTILYNHHYKERLHENFYWKPVKNKDDSGNGTWKREPWGVVEDSYTMWKREQDSLPYRWIHPLKEWWRQFCHTGTLIGSKAGEVFKTSLVL